MGQYIELMKGDEFNIADNYSFIIVVSLINLLYGVGLPILFPLTLFAWITQYAFNWVSITHAQRSPMMDNHSNKNAIFFLKWGVHLYTFAGYWFLTNRQIFYNDVHAITWWSQVEITNHSIYNIQFDYTFPLLIVAFGILTIMLLHSCGIIFVKAAFDDTIKEELRSFENLYSFQDSLNVEDIDWIIMEEKQVQDRLGYFRLNDKQLRSFQDGRNKRL